MKQWISVAIVALLAVAWVVPVAAQPGAVASEPQADPDALEPASKPEPPAARPKYFMLPLEIDGDSGAANGDAVIGRLLPASSIPLGEKWRLLNIAMIHIADAPGGRPGSPGNPESVPGPNVFGLGDSSAAFLFSPHEARWSLGVFLGLPTATDDTLGSGKWSIGPALRFGHRSGPWLLSLLVGNLSSFAGNDDRASTNQLLARVIVRRTLKEKWYFIYAPIITANWNAPSDQRWMVPVGGGFGRHFDLQGTPLNVSLQAYGNAVRPDGAPHTMVRVEFAIPFRLPERLRG